MEKYAVGVDLGGTSIKAALVKEGHGIEAEYQLDTEAREGPDHILDRIAKVARKLIEHAPDEDIAGIGIGSPGAISLDRTTVTQPPNFSDWDEIDVRHELVDRLGGNLPVVVENDANVAGLGSAHYGAGKSFDSFIMVTLGTGVGGAIIHKNKIFRGATGGAGEIGHMTIDYEGPLPRSGVPGAIEAYLGQHFLSRHAKYRLMNQTDSLIHERTNGNLNKLSPRLLFEAARDGDEPSEQILAWAGHKLGCVLGSVVNLLDIRKIVVGGGISGAGDFILEPARQTLVGYVVPGLRQNLQIVREKHGNKIAMLGAAHLLLTAYPDGSAPTS